jgi:hypothetical protein
VYRKVFLNLFLIINICPLGYASHESIIFLIIASFEKKVLIPLFSSVKLLKNTVFIANRMLIIYDVGIIEIMESIDELDSCL